MMEEERLNWQEACKVLGCSKSHFYNLVNTGEIPAERFGSARGTTVKRSDCERYRKEWREREEAGEAR
jgi:excisionase family DNA binding protein